MGQLLQQHNTYLYTLQECTGCEKAKALLSNNNINYVAVEINNPILEFGIMKLLRSNKIIAPLLLKPYEGVYMLNGDATDWIKVKTE